MDDTIEQRIETLERALTDGDHDLSTLATEADTAERLDTLEDDVEELTDRVAELEAATQALRGYVGNVRAVNEDVQQRADLALSKAEAAQNKTTAPDSPAPAASTEPATDGNQTAQTDGGPETSFDSTHSDRFDTPRTDEFDVDPETLAQNGQSSPATHRSPDTRQSMGDEGTDDAGLFARIRELL